MIVAGQLLLAADEPRTARIAPGVVRIEHGVVTEVEATEVPQSSDLGGPNCLVTPGFLDAHVHLPQFDTIGAHGLPLLEWLDRVTFPAEAKWADVDYARGMAERVARQLLSVGTTRVVAFATVHHESTIAAIDALQAAGLRGAVGQSLSDRYAPPDLVGESEALVDQAATLADRFPPGAPIEAALTPRFAASCTPELLHGIGRLAAATPGALVQTHLSETRAECDLIAKLFGGVPYAQVYANAGLATPRSLFAHGIHLSSEERNTLSKAGAVIAHCPTANSFLRSGAMDRAATLAAGVRIALGSDIGAGYERSMVRVARAMIETASALTDQLPSPAHAWWQITAGAADATGFPNAGRLAVGAPADLVVIEPDLPWLASSVDPLAMLLFAWDDRWVRSTLSEGQVAYRAG